MTASALHTGTDATQPDDSERRPRGSHSAGSDTIGCEQPALPPVRPRADLSFYRACAKALEQEVVVWDVGCGDGQGTSLLVSEGRTVLGFDPRGRVNDHRHPSGGAQFMAALPSVVLPHEAPDLIIVADVLGYVEHPESLLLQLSGFAKPSTQLLVWEPRSEPTQQLPAGKLRAWTDQELAELAALGGWHAHDQSRVCATFASLAATCGPPDFVQTLSRLALGLLGAEASPPAGLPPQLAAAVYVQQARVALKARDADRASSYFLDALNVNPTNTIALCGLARLALSGEDLSDAVHLLRTCLELDPANLQASQLWTQVLELTTPEECITAYQALANLCPADANTLSTLAQLHAETGEPLLAIQDLERLRRYHPTPSLGLSLTLGWLLHSVGRNSDAEVEARLASLMDPDGLEVKDLLAALVS